MKATRPGAAAEARGERLLGYWVNTTYVNHASAADVAEAIVAVCTSEGMAQIAAPAQRARLLVEPMQYDVALNAAFCDNLVSVDTLISHKPFAAPGGLVLYFKWPGASRERLQRSASWPKV